MDQNEPPQRSTNWLVLIGSVIFVLLAFRFFLPFLVPARGNSGSCINNLRQLEGAKDQWALENKKTNGTPVLSKEIAEIDQYIKGGFPICPRGGVYSYNSVGAVPTCSIPSHSL